jgi:hypothetical protein
MPFQLYIAKHLVRLIRPIRATICALLLLTLSLIPTGPTHAAARHEPAAP